MWTGYPESAPYQKAARDRAVRQNENVGHGTRTIYVCSLIYIHKRPFTRAATGCRINDSHRNKIVLLRWARAVTDF